MSELVFALDIGTQSVSGILLERQGKQQFHVIDYHTIEHAERSMLDGQIQHVIEVANVIQAVKSRLEERHGPLSKVCVAAAGRALKTVKTKKTVTIANQPLTSQEAVNHLELSAVQLAQLQLTKDNQAQSSSYHCVGFSVLHYYLDGERIGSLIDQTGEEAGVEMITTFLPKVVIESLLAALERADLTMQALTLEPIAAIHVLVPQSMRRLNVALIDIGAGTSDIAISNDGTITAYGMVPVAGDEITEAISDAYLLDFKEAEKAKQQLVNEKTANVQDILGFETELTYDLLIEHISDRTNHLVQLLAEEVRSLNANVPQAVMLIGGGSMTPGLAEKLADALQLPKNRVAIRGVEGISILDKTNQNALPAGPEFVTPIGIAISATENPLYYTSVYVNGELTLMFQTKVLTVGDCLVQAGIDINQYYGKIGLSHIVEINNHPVTLRGTYGARPSLRLNEENTTVNHPIQDNDRIDITKGKDGEEPRTTILEMFGEPKNTIHFLLEEEVQTLQTVYLVNGEPTDEDYIIQDKDQIQEYLPSSIEDFLYLMRPEFLKEGDTSFEITVNHRRINIKSGEVQFFLNGVRATLSSTIHDGDELVLKDGGLVNVEALLQQLDKVMLHSIKIFFNETPVILSQKQTMVFRQDIELKETDTIFPGDILTLKEEPLRPFIFQDVFRHVEIDLSHKNTSYELKINDILAGFHDEIKHGDELEINWS